MKKHLAHLLLIIPLLFIGGLASAAYTYVGPTAAPTGNNTEGPLDVGATDQVKNGGLSVTAFEARGNAYFDQEAAFTGIIRGGTVTNPNNNVSFGESAHPATISAVGDIFISGQYQSDTLKTGGGLKPLCVNGNGQFYICTP